MLSTTAKQVISCCGENKNGCEVYKTIVIHCQICKFVMFLLPSLSWLLELPKLPNGSLGAVANTELHIMQILRSAL